MRRIEKAPPPSCIADLKTTPGANWSSVHGDQKKAMRGKLAEEQHGLCAYCMRRVPEDELRIEHYRSRATDPSQVFSWSNLLGVCEGDVGVQAASDAEASTPSADLRFHCDNYRGQIKSVAAQELFVDPTRLVDPDKTFRYTLAGVIEPAQFVDGARLTEIETTIARLNLNIWRLKRNRAEVRKRVREWVAREFARRSDGDARGELRRWLSRVGEYAEVEHAYLRQKLR